MDESYILLTYFKKHNDNDTHQIRLWFADIQHELKFGEKKLSIECKVKLSEIADVLIIFR